MNNKQIGLVGLGVMGKSLAINLMNHGISVVGYNQSKAPTETLKKEYPDTFTACFTDEELCNQLSTPRMILFMVPAGKPVDDTIAALKPFLAPGDILMDGGNSFFHDTERRQQELASSGIHYFGVGISGGEKGALLGPCMMPGGPREAYDSIKPVLEAIAASFEQQPCVTYIGPGGSGHYVKMVHNGMEYAEMQAIAEVYLALKQDHTNEEIAALFEQWNEGESKSYLLGITAVILKEQDPEGNGSLLDEIVDVAHNKGTGRWTGQQALEQEYDASVLLDAYLARAVSNLTDLRSSYEVTEQGCPLRLEPETLHRAYDLSREVIYAQGFGLYRNASMKYSWNLDLSGIAAIFRAGCIIQCRLLDTLSEQLKQNDDLFMTDWMMEQRNTLLPSLRKVILGSVQHGIPMPVMNGALTFMDQLGSPLLGANLIQAQRDYFGAHTFQRIGNDTFIHHDWERLTK